MRIKNSYLEVLLLLAISSVSGLTGQSTETPLPEQAAFLKGARQKLKSDDELQKHYTYTEKRTEYHLDKDGKVKSTEERVYEIFPGFDEQRTYRRLIEKNGKPLSSREIEEQNKKQQKVELRQRREREKESASERSKRLARKEEHRRKEAEEIDEIFQLCDIRMTGRQIIEGRPTIGFTFTPKAEFKPRTEGGKVMKKIRGTALISEHDQELVRLEVELLENISVGLVLARLNKGARGVLERRMVNNEVWLPARAQFTGNLRLFVFKGLRANVASEYSNYKKFSVETSIKFDSPKP